MIHLAWSGKGFLVPAVTLSTCLCTELLVRAVFHDENYYQANGWPILIAFLISGILIYVLSRRLIEERELQDVTTGELVLLKQDHRFLFVHIKYWPAILCVLGIVLFVIAERRGL